TATTVSGHRWYSLESPELTRLPLLAGNTLLPYHANLLSVYISRMVVMIVEDAIDITAWFWVVLLLRCISIVALDSKWNCCCYCHESRGREVVVGDAAA
ncbi:hypothetical protein PIB30_102439, partial [Stylosanthes scabra]|nr:hypothetical protein [Stylosanthes scabra]